LITLVALVPPVAAAWPRPAVADEPAAALLTASDLVRTGHSIRPPGDGEYTMKVWAPARQVWNLTPGEQAATFTLACETKGEDRQPRWQTIGKLKLSSASALHIQTSAPAVEAKTSEAKPEGKAKSPEKAAVPTQVPALLFLTTDPSAVPEAALDLIRARLDTAEPPPDPRRTSVRTNQQGANFKAPASAQEWRDRARTLRAQLLVTLGLWPMPPKTPLHAHVYGKVERDGYTIEKVVLETLPGFWLGGNLYRPSGKTGKTAALLCPHGHWADGRVNPEVQARCIRWAKLGAVVFLYDMVGYNDSKPFGHEFLNPRLDRWGLSLATLQTWNSIRALDWLTSLPDVDAARLGCTGESGGGTQTFLLTALDDRIAAAAPVVMVSEGFQGGCVCENAAGLRLGTDNVEIAALAAPRPMKLVGATGDWTSNTLTRVAPAIREVYTLMGEPDRLSGDVFPFPHNYNQTSRNAVYAFLGRWLLGIDDPDSTREGEQSPEKPEDLRAFNDQHPAPVGVKTPAQLERDLIKVLSGQIQRLAPGNSSIAWDSARAFLLSSLKVRTGLSNPPAAELASAEIRRSTKDQLTIIHSLVGRKATGEQIPVVRLIPAHPSGRLTVIMHPRGKAWLSDWSGKPRPLLASLLAKGQSVVTFDPLFVGESIDPTVPETARPDTKHFETYNPSLAADRIQDLATVLSWARFQPDVREVNLVALGESGVLALLARPALSGLGRTLIDLHEFDYGDGSEPVPPGLHLPGVLQFGGLKSAAALCAPAPLWIHRAGPNFDESWPVKAYALADASSHLRIDKTRAQADEIARWVDTGEY
jgi:hypothetical protein